MLLKFLFVLVVSASAFSVFGMSKKQPTCPCPTPVPTMAPTPTPSPIPTVPPSPTPKPTSVPVVFNIPTTQSAWHTIYTGFGSISYDAVSGIVLEPKASTQNGETHAALTIPLLTESNPMQNFKVTLKVNTEKQLRLPLPNGWESFWLFFNYTIDGTGKKKTNYLAMKPGGLELGTAFDELGQKFLATSSSPKTVIGKTYTLVVSKVGKHVEVIIDGIKAMAYDGKPTADQLYDAPGSIGLYTEDARVRVTSIVIEKL